MGTCFSCFSSKRSEEDREPLLPRHQRPQYQTPESSEPPPDDPLSKLVDVLAALSVGKLPSQTQINNFLRRILHSNILQESKNARSQTTPEILRGNGPLSKRGRKVIQDVVHAIEALLQFGMEKNDDDLLQDLFSQLSQIESGELPVSFEGTREASTEACRLGKRAGKIKEDARKHVPCQSEVSEDAKTLVKELKSLFTTFLTSSVFRLVLADAISIGREWVAHAASDISNAALRVHNIAEGVEHRAEQDEFDRRAEVPPGDIGPTGMVDSILGEGKATVSGAASDVQESIEEKKQEWGDHALRTEEEVKRKLLARIQEMMNRAQEDPSSRRAIITIIQIIKKYAHKFAYASQGAFKSVQEAVGGSSSGQKGPQPQGSGEGIPTRFADPTSYLPQPYGPPPPESLVPGIEMESPHLQHVFQSVKIMLERIARGHKLDDIMKTLGNIVRHSITAPKSLGKNIGKLTQEELYGDRNETSSVGTAKRPERPRGPPSSAGPSADSERDHDFEERVGLFSIYFSSVGQYLDRALTRPGWATSKTGLKSLEMLYEATQEVMQIAREVVADTEDVIKGGVERVKDLDRAERRLIQAKEDKMMSTRKGGHEGDHKTTAAEEKAKHDVNMLTDQWIEDVATFLKQAGEYVDALERDRTTMKLAHALEGLREDAQDLFGTGKEEIGKTAGKFKTKFQPRARGSGRLGLYTQWLGWALPRLLHLLPLGAIPVPRVEIQTDDTECAIDARWIRGLALQSDQVDAQYGAVSENTTPEASLLGSTVRRCDEVGIGGKLAPDEVLVRQWTEIKVSLAEGLGAAALGADNAQYRMGLAGGSRDKDATGIEATSRMRVYMDGIKACVRGVGYYFKYTGSLVRYEDEGVISIDLGTATGGGRHSGFSLDIELEMDKGDVEVDLHAANSRTGVPILVFEDIDDDSESDLLDPDIPQNFDVQEVMYEAGHHPSRRQSPSRRAGDSNHGRRSPEAFTVGYAGSAKPSINLALANVVPLFRVLNTHVDLRGVRFKIDQSRHWLFNKLIVEPFAGPLIKLAARQALEEGIRKPLEALASGMALIVMEAKERATGRHVRQLSLRNNGEYRLRHEYEEGDGRVKLSDLYATLLERGPEIFQHYIGSSIDVSASADNTTETHAELTSRGVVFSKQTHAHIHHQHQPGISPAMMISAPGSMNDEGSVEGLGLLRRQEREYEREVAESPESSSEEEGTHEVRVAVGTGAQLFPGKGGPYGATKDTRGTGQAVLQAVRDGIEENVGEGYERVKGGLQQGHEGGEGKEKRFVETRQREREGWDWRSSAFDF